jgi:chemotaxis protein CheX
MYKMERRREEFEATCKLFIDSVSNYFKVLTEVDSEMSIPYLKETEDLKLKDFTGMIRVSGNRKGFVYFSAEKNMLVDLISMFIGIDEPSNEDILDMAGEISNVVAGNVRANLGTNFMISVPIVFEGNPDELQFPSNRSVYVIPIKWKNYEAYVVVGFE